MKYKIEKNIPVPPPKSGITGETREFIAQLDVGDSFLIPNNDLEPYHKYLASHWSRKFKDRKFITRLVGEGRRIWRIE